MRKSLIEISKCLWTVDDAVYPGNENIKLGCLQRIALATEATAKNFIALQNERDLYKRWYEEGIATTRRMSNREKALRGVITKQKKKIASLQTLLAQ